MALSVRMNPLLERELELAAQRRGITKSQFVIDAVERALGRKNAYQLMLKLQAEEQQFDPAVAKAFEDIEQPYDADAARETIRNHLMKERDAGGSG